MLKNRETKSGFKIGTALGLLLLLFIGIILMILPTQYAHLIQFSGKLFNS